MAQQMEYWATQGKYLDEQRKHEQDMARRAGEKKRMAEEAALFNRIRKNAENIRKRAYNDVPEGERAGGRRKTKRRHTKRRKSKARRKNL